MRQGEIFLNPPYYSQRAVFAHDPEGGFKIIIIITTTIIIKIYMFIFLSKSHRRTVVIQR